MNIFELYDKYLISPLENIIKELKHENADEKIINELRKLLLKYYKSYYEKSNDFK